MCYDFPKDGFSKEDSGSGRQDRASDLTFLEPGLYESMKSKRLNPQACLALRWLAVLMYTRFLWGETSCPLGSFETGRPRCLRQRHPPPPRTVAGGLRDVGWGPRWNSPWVSRRLNPPGQFTATWHEGKLNMQRSSQLTEISSELSIEISCYELWHLLAGGGSEPFSYGTDLWGVHLDVVGRDD